MNMDKIRIVPGETVEGRYGFDSCLRRIPEAVDGIHLDLDSISRRAPVNI